MTSLTAFVIAIFLLGVFTRQIAIQNLIKIGENKNIALTKAFANSLWPQFAPFVASASELNRNQLRTHPEIAKFRQAVLAQMEGLSVIKVKVYNLDGLTVFSTEREQIGEDKRNNIGFISARAGKVANELTHRATFSAFEGVIEDRDVISSYIPIESGNTIVGVFEVYDDVTFLLRALDETQIVVIGGITLSLSVLFFILFFLVRHADGLLQHQHKELRRNKEGLELRVEERTAQLRILNEQLKREMIERKQMEEERLQLENQLRQTQKLETVGQLAGGVAHEFNNLLTPIIGYVDLVKKQTLEQPEVQASLVMVQKAARRAGGLTKALLSFSRKNPIKLQPQSLAVLAGEVLHLLRQTIDRQIEITLESPGDLWPVLIDADQIHQVIVNLCVNARDALKGSLGERNGFQPSIRIEMKNVHLDEAFCKAQIEARTGDFVCLSVTDNGEGIEEATFPHLFEPFFTTKGLGRGMGTGLGLASSHGIVKRHNGWIGVKTDIGEGAVFEVYLPRTGRPVVKTVQVATDQAETGGTATIMIVDDDELVRNLGKTVLERCGYTVLSAENGVQALEIFKREGRIEIVVLDLSMPSESGWEVLRRLRALDPALKAIISTGYDISGHTQDKGDLAPYTILSKPFTPRDMAQTIRAVLHQDAAH
ncbi:response regulator [bacterium AH-315-L15]|nr:response regulator [bacterium AH-315-L15]